MKSRIAALLLMFFVFAGFCLSKQDVVTDDALTDQIRIKLANDSVVKGGALQVDVKQGVVTLGGAVETPKQKDRAEKLIHKMRGVKQVVNKITIRK
jgi:osmotically-inducible protein OsmY